MVNNPFGTAPPPAAGKPAPRLARYEFRGATVDAPSEWGEDSALALVPNLECAITLRRVSVEKDTTLDFYVSQRISDLSPTVEGLVVQEIRETALGGARAMRLKLAWTEPMGPFGQWLVIALFGETAFALAMTGAPDDLVSMQSAFDSVATSFRFPGTPLR